MFSILPCSCNHGCQTCVPAGRDRPWASVSTVQNSEQVPEISLAGRVALMTGGSGGIGRAVALALASAGASVAIGYGANDAAAHHLAGQITAAGGRAAGFLADLETFAGAQSMVTEALSKWGQVDVLINNVGGTIWAKPYQHYEE